MPEGWAPKKPNFGPPPKGYVPGLGRGAVGFVTRGDLGPAARQAAAKEDQQGGQDNDPAGQFDGWEGQKGALFAKAAVDEEDRQAEEAYDFIEKRFDQRHEKKKQKQKKQPEQNLDEKAITSKFVDLKRDLAKMSGQEWELIPDCHDQVAKKKKFDKYTPVPDTMVVNLMRSNQNGREVEDGGQNLQDFRQAKQVLLTSKLDNTSRPSQNTLDKVGYMTQLNTSQLDPQFMGDLKRARLLLKSAISSSSRNPDIWLSAARVQELDGKLKDARELLRKAIDACPTSEDLWMELSRLQRPQHAQDVLIEGLRNLPDSEKLWLFAARREQSDQDKKSKIIRKGLENIPASVALWRELIEMADPQEAKQLLYKAVEALPKQIDLWLALAKAQDYKQAQKVLNKARKYNPLNLAIWISAARLQEAHSKSEGEKDPKFAGRIESILVKAREVLKKNGAAIVRQDWLEEAVHAQKSGSEMVCQMLVKISVGLGLSEQELNNVLVRDAKWLQTEREANLTTRFLFQYGIELIKSQPLMRLMIQFQNRKKLRKEYHQLDKTLLTSVKLFQMDTIFWQTTVNKLTRQQQYEVAINMIRAALPTITQIQTQRELRLMMIKIMLQQAAQQSDQTIEQRAKSQLQVLIQESPNKNKMKELLIRVEYQSGNYEQAWKICQQTFKESGEETVWRLAYQIKKQLRAMEEALAIAEKATQCFPSSITLWKDLVQLHVARNNPSRARAALDKAQKSNPNSVELALLAIRLERQVSTNKEAVFAVAKALKNFPKNPEVWAVAIELQPTSTRKKKASTAIDVCGQHSAILVSVAKAFWKEGKTDKSKNWFQKAVQLNPNNGDGWALYLNFLKQYLPNDYEGGLDQFNQVEGEIQGEKWRQVVEGRGGWKLTPRQVLFELMKVMQDELRRV